MPINFSKIYPKDITHCEINWLYHDIEKSGHFELYKLFDEKSIIIDQKTANMRFSVRGITSDTADPITFIIRQKKDNKFVFRSSAFENEEEEYEIRLFEENNEEFIFYYLDKLQEIYIHICLN